MKKILIVDDQPSIRRLVSLVLRDSFLIEEASDADTAYQRLLADRPDAVVLDVMMPGSMDGYQLCELIKRDTALAGIHVVLITARGQVSDQEFGLALGADAYFVKPFSPLGLLHHLTNALLGTAPTPDVAVRTSPGQNPLLNNFEAAWKHSPMAMIAVGRDGNVCAVNPAFERRTGMSEAAVLGMGEAGLNTLLDSLALKNTRIETNDCTLRAIHYLNEARTPAKGAPQLSQIAALLREPLASIFGFAELLLTQNYPEDVRHDLTATLLEQIEAMSNILNERLNLSRRNDADLH